MMQPHPLPSRPTGARPRRPLPPAPASPPRTLARHTHLQDGREPALPDVVPASSPIAQSPASKDHPPRPKTHHPKPTTPRTPRPASPAQLTALARDTLRAILQDPNAKTHHKLRAVSVIFRYYGPDSQKTPCFPRSKPNNSPPKPLETHAKTAQNPPKPVQKPHLQDGREPALPNMDSTSSLSAQCQTPGVPAQHPSAQSPAPSPPPPPTPSPNPPASSPPPPAPGITPELNFISNEEHEAKWQALLAQYNALDPVAKRRTIPPDPHCLAPLRQYEPHEAPPGAFDDPPSHPPQPCQDAPPVSGPASSSRAPPHPCA